MMQVDNVQDPNICNTAPHERCPKGEILHVLARSFPDTPSTKRTIAAPQYTHRTKQYVLAHLKTESELCMQ